MNILGLYWGFGSAAALFSNNCINRCVSEERFSRIKNDDVFPMNAAQYCLDGLDQGCKDLDALIIPSFSHEYWYSLKRKATWTIDDYLEEQHKCWFPRLIEGKDVDPRDYLQHRIDIDQYPTKFWKESLDDKHAQDNFDKSLLDKLTAEAIGIDVEKVHRVEHHACHAYYAYYASELRSEPVLVMTIDGMGDGLNATINIFYPSGKVERVYATDQANIGRIYRYITLHLGMKPNEHEFKVMGLAPYAQGVVTQKPYELFKSTLYVDGIEFKWRTKPQDSYFWFKDRLEGCRFDGISAGLQKWTEELLCQWVSNAASHFGIKKVILAGGVAMNIKANGEMAKLPGVETLFVPGAPSDDSLVMGGIYAHMTQAGEKVGARKEWSPKLIKPLENLYLGPNNSYKVEAQAVKDLSGNGWEVLDEFTAADIATELVAGKIIARCAGRMEFGARALCNRSILADPINMSIVSRINSAIKNRDFWMPFAPVIMDKWINTYLDNPKDIYSPYMTIGFESTEKGWHDLPAGCHQADRTVRPQMLKEVQNPEVYEILMEFEKITGRGALLNTSFNLHGFPIVNTPREAFQVFRESQIDILVLNHFLIKKQKC